MRTLASPQYTCWPVIAEAVYLLRDSSAARQSLFAKITAGDLILLPLTHEDAPAIAQILQKYHDQQVDLADACLVHLAERESITTVFSLDRRHFSIYRTQSGKAVTLLPG